MNKTGLTANDSFLGESAPACSLWNSSHSILSLTWETTVDEFLLHFFPSLEVS